MNPKPYREVLDEAVREAVPDDLRLFPAIAARLEKGKKTMNPRLRFAMTTLLVLAVVAAGFLAAPGVASAMGRLLGYLPGIGLVDQSGAIRVLENPVQTEKNGIHIVVEKGSIDSERTVLLYTLEGIHQDSSGRWPVMPQLRLPDGQVLISQESGGQGAGEIFTMRATFAAIPEGVNDIQLEMPCPDASEQTANESFCQVKLHFVPADPQQLVPVIELPTAAPVESSATTAMPALTVTPEPESTAVPEAAPATEVVKENLSGITLTLDRVAELEDGYVLYASLNWTDPNLLSVSIINPELVDANGQAVSFGDEMPDFMPDAGVMKTNFAYRIFGKEQAWPVKLTVGADVDILTQESFPLDLSSPPQPGEKKPVNLDITVFGQPLHIADYAILSDADGNTEIKFSIEAAPKVIGAMLIDRDHWVLGAGGGGDGEGLITTGFTYKGALPTGMTRIFFTSLMLRVEGWWSATWQP